MNNNNDHDYAILPKLLHWSIALIIIGLLSLGWYMMSVADQPDVEIFFDVHKSFGLIVATLILIRITWRLGFKPKAITTSPAWQVKLARSVHYLLYALMIGMPLTGFFGSLLSQWGVNFFGLQFPVWFTPNKPISETLFSLHSYFAWCILGLIILHILAALKHLFINKDDVFQRMWFRSKKPSIAVSKLSQNDIQN